MRLVPPDVPVSVADQGHPAELCDLGRLDYGVCHRYQQELAARRRDGGLGHDRFLVVEHPPVFTLGRRGGRQSLMVSDQFLAERGIPITPIERGGDITYHGPGQLVIYPIIHLRQSKLTVADYVWHLEEVMRELSAAVGVTAERDSRNHGVWAEGRKLGSIGIAIRHSVSFHGLALNVCLDLEPFGWVNPCGLSGVSMTSLSQQLGRQVSMQEIKSMLKETLGRVFARRFHWQQEDVEYGWMQQP